jgi:hypothetical protein
MFQRSFKQDAIQNAQSGVIDASVAVGAWGIPSGTTAQRPNSPVQGMLRYNTDLAKLELYVPSQWVQL